jgi:hypothetical protein
MPVRRPVAGNQMRILLVQILHMRWLPADIRAQRSSHFRWAHFVGRHYEHP